MTAGAPASTTKPQFSRSAAPWGAARCSRRRPRAAEAATPSPAPTDNVMTSTERLLRTPGLGMLVGASPERRSRPRRNRRPHNGRRSVYAGVRRVVVLRQETSHVEGAHLWVLLGDPHHRAVHRGEPE